MNDREQRRRATAELVAAEKVRALALIRAALPKLVAELPDKQWRKLRNKEDRRRAKR